MFRIPFEWMPGSWGLKGKTREIAKAEYELSGYDLELKLLTINHEDPGSDDWKRKNAEIELRYKRISEEDYYRCLADLVKDQTQRELAVLEIDYRAGKIKELDYAKQVATIKKEPWVTVINMDFAGKSALEGSFELDWNEFFVDKLRNAGYNGPTPDAIVNQWFMEVCRNVAMEEFDGTGDFTADSAANLETVKRWHSESLPSGKKGYS